MLFSYSSMALYILSNKKRGSKCSHLPDPVHYQTKKEPLLLQVAYGILEVDQGTEAKGP